jgi:hypothetical protein
MKIPNPSYIPHTTHIRGTILKYALNVSMKHRIVMASAIGFEQKGLMALHNSSIRLIFENDRIKLPVISWNTDLGENVHLSTDSIDGVVFETVYVARPDFESHTHIDSVYYIPDTGVIRIFTTGGEIWQRVF